MSKNNENPNIQEDSLAVEPKVAQEAGQPNSADESAVQAMEAALKEANDRYLYLAAEYDNFRKRSQREKEAAYGAAKSDIVSQLLPIYDNLERALKQSCNDEAFYKGVEMTMTQLKNTFQQLGVTEIPALGEPFNPELHHAVMHVEDDTVGENTIVEVFQTGFTLQDKVIRFSVVRVAN